MKFKDQIGRVFELKRPPKKIISLVPSQTELLVDLGLEENIVGITKFCVHPKELKKKKTIIGGTKNINIEKIRSLQPDIILCNKEENTKEIVEDCQEITSTHVSELYTLNDTLKLIKEYGLIFNKVEEAESIVNQINYKKNKFELFIKNYHTKKVAYFIWKNPWMVASSNTFIDHLLTINKFENVFSNKERYPEIDLNSLKELQPEIILLSSEPYPFKEKHIDEISKLAPNTKIILVDGEMFSWYGSRLMKAFDYFKALRNRV